MKDIIDIAKGKIVLLLLVLTCFGCSDYDEPLIEELDVDRVFAPVGLTARVRNQTIVELNWTINDEAVSYIAQFSEDPDFNNIVQFIEVTGDQLPVQVQLEGETLYSIRVQAISDKGLDDSSWAVTSAQTLAEQLFLPAEPGDVKATEAIFRWLPNSNVTQIVVNPGNIIHNITAQEKVDGIATVTGLSPETDYLALLLNNTKRRGTASFTTGIDIGAGILVQSTDDLFQFIADANPGDILVLESGDYTAQTGSISLNKSLTIRGLRNYDKPLLNVNFEINAGAVDVELIDLDLRGDGEGSSSLQDVARYTEAGAYNSLLISGCNIHDYSRSFIAGNETDAIVQSVTVENSIITNIYTSGGDFIDFRNSDVLNLTITTSTFNNCAPGRDFIRLDAAGTSNGNSTCNILLESCTLYACSNSSSRRLLYVRFQTNIVTVKNMLITETLSEGYADRAGIDESPTFENNNYFNAPGYFDSSQFIFDNGNFTDLDPGFVDVSAGNFTVTNQVLLDNEVGDPRWRIQ